MATNPYNEHGLGPRVAQRLAAERRLLNPPSMTADEVKAFVETIPFDKVQEISWAAKCVDRVMGLDRTPHVYADVAPEGFTTVERLSDTAVAA